MEKVIILGAGAHAAEIEGYIEDNNQAGANIEIVGYLDDVSENHQSYGLKAPLLGGLFGYSVPTDIQLIIAVNSIEVRERIIEEYKNSKFFTFVHITSRVFHNVEMGEGNIICPFTQIGPKVKIGSFNTFNNKASIGHDCVIVNNNVFCPNVGLSGNTHVGNSNFFSLNVATIPNVKIGNKNVIAANMVIEKTIKDESYFFHRFKEVVLVIPKEN